MSGRGERTQRMVKGILAATAAAAIWGGMYVVSKLVLDVVPPLMLVVIRFAIALPVLGVWHGLTEVRAGRRLTWRAFLSLAPAAFVGFCLSLAAQFAGTRLSSASLGAVITSATPAFVVPCALLVLGERPSAYKLAGLAVASLGVWIVVSPADGAQAAPGAQAALGAAMLVAAAFTWALYSVLVKRHTQAGMSALSVTLGVTAWGIVFDVPLAAVEAAGSAIGAITLPVVAGMLYLGVVSTAIAFYLWNKGFELLDANTAALCFFAQPLVGAALGTALLGETLGVGFVVGGTLIAVGALVSQIEPRRRRVAGT